MSEPIYYPVYYIEHFPNCDRCGKDGTVWKVREQFNIDTNSYEKYLEAILCEDCDAREDAQEAG